MHANYRAHVVAKWVVTYNFFGVIPCNYDYPLLSAL
jgi:hypothetical protein